MGEQQQQQQQQQEHGQPQQEQQQQPQEQKQQQLTDTQGTAPPGDIEIDFIAVPAEMDRCFEKLDTDGILRPAIITPGDTWTRHAQKALVASPVTSTLGSED